MSLTTLCPEDVASHNMTNSFLIGEVKSFGKDQSNGS
jgi:hypothetical protein